MVAILGYSRRQILGAVQQMYAEVARRPEAGFHFPVGRNACEALGYPPTWLDRLPGTVLDAFAGVGCPWRGEVIRPGDRVLDIGAGAGVDTGRPSCWPSPGPRNDRVSWAQPWPLRKSPCSTLAPVPPASPAPCWAWRPWC